MRKRVERTYRTLRLSVRSHWYSQMTLDDMYVRYYTVPPVNCNPLQLMSSPSEELYNPCTKTRHTTGLACLLSFPHLRDPREPRTPTASRASLPARPPIAAAFSLSSRHHQRILFLSLLRKSHHPHQIDPSIPSHSPNHITPSSPAHSPSPY